MSNETATTATAYTRTIVHHTATIELPDGTVAELSTMTAVCIGGIIGDDWAAERVQQAARYSAEGI